MKSSLRVFLLVVAIAALVAPTIHAQIPHLLAWQGVALDSLGQPVPDSAYFIQFSIWSAPSGGDSLWGEDHAVITENGVVNVILGGDGLLTDSIFSAPDRYLQIQFGNDAPYMPRTRIVSVGYSFRTGSVDGASGGAISGSLAVGSGNSISGPDCFAAGRNNVISANFGSIGGGDTNTVNGIYGAIGGGQLNLAGAVSAVAGGFNNAAANSYAAIGGGESNTVLGAYATIPGGRGNRADGVYSFAAGHRARASHAGCFVWADSSNADFTTTADEQFIIRADGGVGIGTNAPGFPLEMASGAHVTVGGVWTNASDKRLKENFESVDREDLLKKISELPIERWNYKNEDESIQHIGPVAQDFYALFGVGNDDRSISTIDPAGIALAAIQELDKKMKRIEELETRLDAMESLMRDVLDTQSETARVEEVH